MRVNKATFMRPAGARDVRAAGPVGAPIPAAEASHRLPSLALPGCVRVFGKGANIFCGIRLPRGGGIRVRMEQMPGTNKRVFLNKVAKIAVE